LIPDAGHDRFRVWVERLISQTARSPAAFRGGIAQVSSLSARDWRFVAATPRRWRRRACRFASVRPRRRSASRKDRRWHGGFLGYGFVAWASSRCGAHGSVW